MLADQSVINFGLEGLWVVTRVSLVTFTALYFVFSLIVARQVSFMTDSLRTAFSGYLRFSAILHAGISLGVVVVLLGILLM